MITKRLFDLLRKPLDFRKELENESKKRSNILYIIVVSGFSIAELFSFFSISNIAEILAVVFSIIILLFLLSRRKSYLINGILYLYVILFMGAAIVTSIIGKPFLGIFANEDNLQAFYDNFSKGLYQYSIGNFNGAISE